MCCCDKPLIVVRPFRLHLVDRRDARTTRHRHASRRGQSLVEFAVVSIVVYMLLAAILTFGQALFCDQTLQQAADVAAREISRTPLPAAQTSTGDPMTLTHVLYGDASTDTSLQDVRKRVFDERYLVLSIDPIQSGTETTYNGGHPIGDFPVVIQQLLPLMIYEPGLTEGTVDANGIFQPIHSYPDPGSGISGYLRYSGAVFRDPKGPDTTVTPPTSGFLVRIPVVSVPAYPAPATQSILKWLYPLEPILDSQGTDAFAVNSITVSGQSGMVALRLNYPYQSASMSGFQPPADPTTPSGPPDNPVIPIPANNAISATSLPPGVGNPVVSAWQFGASSGVYGLGQQLAWASVVRPYRSLFSAQAIHRREVFQ